MSLVHHDPSVARRTLLVAIGLLLGLATPLRAQLSPGPLARAHEELDTPLQCLACHGKGGGGSPRERCLLCHKEIAWLVERHLGYHAQRGREDCAKCHPDHAGREFEMVRWDEGSPERFEHRQTGWTLEGKHSEVKCRDCHQSKYMVAEPAKLTKRKHPADGWVGLDRACVSCHEDIHRGALGMDCGKCHGTKAWKPAAAFDHAKTDYPLTGKHAQVTCEKCHSAPSLQLARDASGKLVPLYKPLPHSECSACHKDPHAGRLGPACARCHVTDSWQRVGQTVFNHDLTRYPLRGRHAAQKCEQCHDPVKAWGKKPAFATCGACHRDPHSGLATIAGKAVDCEACHNVVGFSPSTFTVAQHQRSSYALEGRHREVGCEKCHLKNPPRIPSEKLGKAGVLIRPSYARCRDCHGYAHGGQLSKRPDQGACEPCHRVDGWKPSTFTAKEHARLKLALDGGHAKVECAACHGPSRKGLPPLPEAERLGSARVALLLPDVACTACHFDPHEGRFEALGARPKKTSCLACHGFDVFRPSTVDVTVHGDFGYALEGSHRATACDACHVESKRPAAKSSLLLTRGTGAPMPFTTKSQKCEACHETPHGDQFARHGEKGECESCHDVNVFRPASRFDHDRDASFPLEGAHARVACARCHPSVKGASGRTVVVYRPVAKECKACHGERDVGPLSRTGAAMASGRSR